MFWFHCGSEEHGGELFGEYDTAEEAAQAIARSAISAFKVDRHNIGSRSYTIIEAASKAAAEKIVARQFPQDPDPIPKGLDESGRDADGTRRGYW